MVQARVSLRGVGGLEGDNRRVDFSRTLIFMTSNLGASEMGSILRPKLGFAASEVERRIGAGQLDDSTADKISRAGLAAARHKFTPEFMNRLDKVVVFKPLGQAELRKILELELGILQMRIFDSSTTTPFVFSLTEAAKDYSSERTWKIAVIVGDEDSDKDKMFVMRDYFPKG